MTIVRAPEIWDGTITGSKGHITVLRMKREPEEQNP